MNLEIKFVLVFESLCPFIFLLYESRDDKQNRKRSILLQQNENAHLNHVDILGKIEKQQNQTKTKPWSTKTRNPKALEKLRHFLYTVLQIFSLMGKAV